MFKFTHDLGMSSLDHENTNSKILFERKLLFYYQISGSTQKEKRRESTTDA